MNQEILKKYNTAAVFQNSGNYEEARKIYEEIIELNTNNADVFHNLGLICFDEKKYNDAINYFTKAIELAPDNFDTYFSLGVLYRETNDLEKAIHYFRNAIELNPNDKEAYAYWENTSKLLKKNLEENKNQDIKKEHAETKQVNILKHKGPKVIVYSYNNVQNFGDRLGYHLIPLILPANSHIDFAKVCPYDVLAPKKYDLLIMGIGNSLFEPIINQQGFVNLIKSAPKSIGIFGTQYRESINKELMNEIIDSLDFWFARYQDDIDYYGKNKRNIYHLGDWLVSLFPITQYINDEILVVGKQIEMAGSLDRLIQYIQKYRKVYSKRLHSLLCALCSAEYAAYEEQYEYYGQTAGKLQNLMLDIFGEIYPEKEFFLVDKQKVIDYKTKILNNMEIMKTKIREIL